MRQFRVLAVDDEPRILNFLSAKLRASGYEVLTASNGSDAIEKAQAQEPDLIVLDVVMPKMDGFETLKELRTFSAVPVIFLSARGADTDRIKGLGLGADDYLPKPFSPAWARPRTARRMNGMFRVASWWILADGWSRLTAAKSASPRSNGDC
jgi:DNA-binding response OmpR family regulator